MDDDDELTPEEAAWIVAHRHEIGEGPPTGAVIGPLQGEDAVKFLELVRKLAMANNQ